MNPFRHGVTEILKRQPAPVVPMALRGLWGSMFSRHAASGQERPTRRGLTSRLTLAVGEPVAPADVTVDGLQRTVSHLRGARR
jgi:1-acyl-sn-glycerol-3-phosphate acyltransferase